MRGDSPLAAPHEERPRQTPGRRRSWEQRQGQPRCRPRHGAVRDAVMTMVVRVADVADAGRMCAEDGGVTAAVRGCHGHGHGHEGGVRGGRRGWWQ